MPSHVRFLPLLIFVATLSFAVRLGDVLTGLRSPSGAAWAEEKKAAAPTSAATAPADTAKKTDAPPATAGTSTDKTADQSTDKATKEKDNPTSLQDWPDPTEMDPALADVKNSLLKDLAARRKQLDDREQQLVTREALLKAAESELEQKYRELAELRKDLQNLLNQQSDEEKARMKSLVKIYEGMKPADAARIFNTLDLTILLDVLTNMSERKSAVILAAMDPDRARTVTLMMAQQKKLPELPPLSSGQQ